MKFHEWQTLYEFAGEDGKRLGLAAYYNEARGMVLSRQLDIESACIVATEYEWYGLSRPYFKVWPAVMKALLNVSLDVKLNSFSSDAPRSIAIRFCDGSEPLVAGRRMCSMIIGRIDSNSVVFIGCRSISCNPRRDEEVIQSYQAFNIRTGGDLTIQELLDLKASSKEINYIRSCKHVSGTVEGSPVSLELSRAMIRCSAAIMLLANDPSIITPDVLSKDAERYARETDEDWKRRAEERAKRRGKVGWNIGAEYEVCPHYRRPHFGIRHTGKGRTTPRIVPIKGAVVHRSKLTEVPTGYILPDGTEVEGGKVAVSP